MVRVGVFVNRLSSMSIPVEIAAEVQHITDIDILLISYYDSHSDQIDPDISELEIPTKRLGANKRVEYNAYFQLRKICNKDDIQVLHTHHNSTGSLGRIAVAGTNTAVVNTEHNDHRFFSFLQKVSNSVSYPLIDINVSNSSSTLESFEWYEQLLLTGVQNGIIYNGINQDRIDNAQKSPVKLPDDFKIVIVGSLTKQKNHEGLLRAFESVNSDVSNSSLIIIGDGPLSAELKTLARKIGINESTYFTGYLPRREDVYAVMKRCNLGVFPSWYEGFCVAAVEAMAVGLPVVVSDIDVLNEVVGDPGVYADPNNPTEFADAITNLLKNPQKRERLGISAKERARAKFTLERTAKKYYEVYNQVADKLC